MVIFQGNGNSGPEEGTIYEPATAKNCISVGASDKGLNPKTSGLPDFTSRGPTSDGRIKPDIITPGAFISTSFSDRDINSYNCNKLITRGTSFATPIAAGLAALVRQYYTDGYYPTGKKNPDNAFNPVGWKTGCF